ncbi:MAG: hypothetical protein AAF702_15745 [Chloroflexota bacterium]
MQKSEAPVVIIGGGIAGYTTPIFLPSARGQPVTGPVDEVEGFILTTGFSGMASVPV